MASHGQRHVVVRGCLSHIFPKSAYFDLFLVKVELFVNFSLKSTFSCFFDQVDLFRAKKLEAELDEFRQRNSVSMANLVRWTKKLVNWPTWPTWPGQKSNFLAAMARHEDTGTQACP